MVVWRSRPRHPPEKKKLGSFASQSCNDGKNKSEMHEMQSVTNALTIVGKRTVVKLSMFF